MNIFNTKRYLIIIFLIYKEAGIHYFSNSDELHNQVFLFFFFLFFLILKILRFSNIIFYGCVIQISNKLMTFHF